MKGVIICSIIFLSSLTSCTSSNDFEKGVKQLEAMGIQILKILDTMHSVVQMTTASLLDFLAKIKKEKQ